MAKWAGSETTQGSSGVVTWFLGAAHAAHASGGAELGVVLRAVDRGGRRDVLVWNRMLRIRSLAATDADDCDMNAQFLEIIRSAGGE